MTYIRVPVPRVGPAFGSNLLGVAGLIAIVCAVAALTSWKWGLLAAGVFAVVLTVIAQSQESAPAETAVAAPAAPRQPSRIEAEAERILAEAARASKATAA